MSTDHDWIQWGQRDPYFAVITDPRYRSAVLTEDARRDFFESGRWHARHVLATCRRVADGTFAPQSALDFGCGVGRVAIPLAEQIPRVLGVDVSPAMLAEAQRNAARMGCEGARWLRSDDTLSMLDERFDLVHSCITFQHIDIARGRRLFARLIDLLAPGGVGAIQITYAKARHTDNWGQPPAPAMPAPPARPAGSAPPPRAVGPTGDPNMEMNAYALGELGFILQRAGIARFHAEFTDHGGEWGVFLYFQSPAG